MNSDLPKVPDVSLNPQDIEDGEEVESSEGSQTLFSAVKDKITSILKSLNEDSTIQQLCKNREPMPSNFERSSKVKTNQVGRRRKRLI